MRNIIILFLCSILGLFSCSKQEKINEPEINSKIKVLNFGTFHMAETPDLHKSAFNSNDKKNQNEAREICILLAKFKPTIICVEEEPENEYNINEAYKKYKKNPNINYDTPSEVELIAYELGRISDVKKIYCINYMSGYNYPKIQKLAKEIDAKTYLRFMNKNLKEINKIDTLKNLKEKLREINTREYLNYLININADIMTHVNTKDNFEGADVAAEFYKRNLRMYANINKIPVKDNDRIFILSGATHAAFFKMFMERSPKYQLVEVSDYLK